MFERQKRDCTMIIKLTLAEKLHVKAVARKNRITMAALMRYCMKVGMPSFEKVSSDKKIA